MQFDVFTNTYFKHKQAKQVNSVRLFSISLDAMETRHERSWNLIFAHENDL